MPSGAIDDSQASALSTVLNDIERAASPVVHHLANALRNGDLDTLLTSPAAQSIVDGPHGSREDDSSSGWADGCFTRLSTFLSEAEESTNISLCGAVGCAALLAFVQANFTGPPLQSGVAQAVLWSHQNDPQGIATVRDQLRHDLTVDAIPIYRLTPCIEFLCLADTIFSHPSIKKNLPTASWLRLRTTFLHQRVLSEPSSTLQGQLYVLLDEVENYLHQRQATDDLRAEFLLEKASIETYYGNDREARKDISEAARKRKFHFALTGRLGKRTKFQDRDVSQLVVLAKSNESIENKEKAANGVPQRKADVAPQSIDLNDDTLLEAISFTKDDESAPAIVPESDLPSGLVDLDANEQPQLQPLDSVVLLALASAITNTSPADGLTREETLPYATRVLEGGSSNWQIYTQALLIRSRIEGYKSRTVERGLLQLQALVDQVIAETTSPDEQNGRPDQATFLPRVKEADSAPASERLQYFFQLASPSRWELEAELAQRWVQLGGLRSALDIYERLEMWPEAALCWAATDREDKARLIIRKLLHLPTTCEGKEAEDEKWEGALRDPLPADAPRLFCILGDLDKDPQHYEKAWEVSGRRYARAQRELGKYRLARKDYGAAALAYNKSLTVNQLNQSSWFAMGCALLELNKYQEAASAFTRCVQLDEHDAEAWSNLAAALLKKPLEEPAPDTAPADDDIIEQSDTASSQRQKSRQDALRALKRAATLKHDSYRIWENVLIVAASLDPPDSTSAIAAQSRIIDLRGGVDGEKCVDAETMSMLVRLVISSSSGNYAAKPGPERMVVELFDRKITPLITSSGTLWSLVARLAIWRDRPASALEANEKAWRALTSQPAWEAGTEAKFNQVVEATVDLCDAYETLGPRETTEGLAAGQDGALVAKDWKFKARSAVRGVIGKAKGNWDGTEGWDRLQDALDGLKG